MHLPNKLKALPAGRQVQANKLLFSLRMNLYELFNVPNISADILNDYNIVSFWAFYVNAFHPPPLKTPEFLLVLYWYLRKYYEVWALVFSC